MITPYNRDEPVYVSVQTGNPKLDRGYRLLIGSLKESGYKQKPIDTSIFTERSVSRTELEPGMYSGNLGALPTVPYYGENDAPALAAAIRNAAFGSVGSWQGITQLELAYLCSVTRNVALTRLHDSMMGDLSTSALGVSLIEGRESLKMIGQRCGNLAATIYWLTRGNVQKARESWERTIELGRFPSADIVFVRKQSDQLFRQLSDKLSSGWLEYWLGWAPIVSDVEKSLDVLATMAQSLATDGILVKGSAKRTFEYNGKHLGAYRRSKSLKATGHLRTTFVGRVLVSDENEFLTHRAGLTNLSAIIYAGIGKSFIFNWFVDVSRVLQLLDAFKGITWVTGVQSHTIHCEVAEHYEHRLSNGGAYTAEGKAISKAQYSQRKLQKKAPLPGLLPQIMDLSTIFEGKEHRAATLVTLLNLVYQGKARESDMRLVFS